MKVYIHHVQKPIKANLQCLHFAWKRKWDLFWSFKFSSCFQYISASPCIWKHRTLGEFTTFKSAQLIVILNDSTRMASMAKNVRYNLHYWNKGLPTYECFKLKALTNRFDHSKATFLVKSSACNNVAHEIRETAVETHRNVASQKW